MALSMRNMQCGRVSSRQAVARPCVAVRPARTMPIVRANAATPAEAPKAVSTEKTGPNFKALRDINQIMQTLPHRYPFLLVDRVVEWEKEKYAVGYKCVTINDNFFTGHFPERPIMPGVLQIEAMAQLAGIVMLDPEDTAAKGLFFFGGIEGCRFRKPVVPGDVLMMRAEVTKFNKRFGIVKVAASGYVGEDLVVEAELTLAMGKQ
ncbi:hypothetical protein Agub_g1346 [Astrephomene gubernaculifera]|uniref:3-hydroxyacyl-[acyl-carrier-protein] dehydratase n=1 Tax=Astrephomene gubernaculifera TaxID=47775 RepID=A0AAD3DF86_9CHLO|nr:hypothetical protein Agub_g1346 [Astrephomene gubernaculifera]